MGKNGQILRLPLIKGAEALADDLAGVDDGDKATWIVLAQEVAQLQCLTAGQHRDQNAELVVGVCLLYTSPSPRDQRGSRMPSSA